MSCIYSDFIQQIKHQFQFWNKIYYNTVIISTSTHQLLNCDNLADSSLCFFHNRATIYSKCSYVSPCLRQGLIQPRLAWTYCVAKTGREFLILFPYLLSARIMCVTPWQLPMFIFGWIVFFNLWRLISIAMCFNHRDILW